MAVVLLSHTGEGSATGGNAQDNVTTQTPIDTTGATLIVIAIVQYDGSTVVVPTDSQSNLYTLLTTYATVSTKVTLAYKDNPSTSASHTFSYSSASSYPAICALAFSGTKASPFNSENGNTGPGGTTFLATNNAFVGSGGGVIVSGLGLFIAQGSAPSLSTMTVTDFIDVQSGQMGGAAAYEIVASSGNDTWTWTNGSDCATAIAGFDAPTSTTFDWMTHAPDRPAHYSKLSMIDSGPRPGRGI